MLKSEPDPDFRRRVLGHPDDPYLLVVEDKNDRYTLIKISPIEAKENQQEAIAFGNLKAIHAVIKLYPEIKRVEFLDNDPYEVF